MRVLPLLLLMACSEFRVDDGPRVPPADPPEDIVDEQGEPPDWNTCSGGFLGMYYNLPSRNPAVGPLAPQAPEDPVDVPEWFDDDLFAFSRYDPTIDFGNNWWPVDEGIEGDPAYFTVSWTAWLRVYEWTTMTVILGAADDTWVMIDNEVVAAVTDEPAMEPVLLDLDMSPGQYPVHIEYAHRKAAAAGFRFRILDGDVSICYPDFPDSDE